VRGKGAPKEALKELKKRIPGKVKLYEEHLDVLQTPDYSFLERFVLQINQPEKRKYFMAQVQEITKFANEAKPPEFLEYEKYFVSEESGKPQGKSLKKSWQKSQLSSMATLSFLLHQLTTAS